MAWSPADLMRHPLVAAASLAPLPNDLWVFGVVLGSAVATRKCSIPNEVDGHRDATLLGAAPGMAMAIGREA